MSQPAQASLGALQERLGHRFGDERILIRALTHGSAATRDAGATYERLEFLGDRVLGLIVADMLLRTFPHADEGELARRFNALVRRETCAEVARDLDIGRDLVLGQSEERSGGRAKAAILADAAESVIAAIYRDGGFEASRLFVETHWRPRMQAAERPRRDAKTALQEWAQGGGRPPPVYEIVARAGPDHAPRFRLRVALAGQEQAFGEGRSKRDAEQIAAAALLVRLGVWTDDDAAS